MRRLYRAEACLTLGDAQMTDQLSGISKLRWRDRLGELGGPDMESVEKANYLQVGL